MSLLRVYSLGRVDYGQTLAQQKIFTDQRGAVSVDEVWFLQHTPTYTLGLTGKRNDIFNQNNIPVYQTDRGGQVTYHGPGQLVVYLLLDLRRKAISVKDYVYSLETAVVNMLKTLNIPATRQTGVPGVYVNEKKIAALGIRIRKGCCYHGISLNVDMDLTPFKGINPCGYPGLEVTQLSDLGQNLSVVDVGSKLLPFIMDELKYGEYHLQGE